MSDPFGPNSFRRTRLSLGARGYNPSPYPYQNTHTYHHGVGYGYGYNPSYPPASHFPNPIQNGSYFPTSIQNGGRVPTPFHTRGGWDPSDGINGQQGNWGQGNWGLNNSNTNIQPPPTSNTWGLNNNNTNVQPPPINNTWGLNNNNTNVQPPPINTTWANNYNYALPSGQGLAQPQVHWANNNNSNNSNINNNNTNGAQFHASTWSPDRNSRCFISNQQYHQVAPRMHSYPGPNQRCPTGTSYGSPVRRSAKKRPSSRGPKYWGKRKAKVVNTTSQEPVDEEEDEEEEEEEDEQQGGVKINYSRSPTSASVWYEPSLLVDSRIFLISPGATFYMVWNGKKKANNIYISRRTRVASSARLQE